MFGVIGVGDKVHIKEGEEGIIEKILFAIPERQTTFFIRTHPGTVISIPYRYGMKLEIEELDTESGV